MSKKHYAEGKKIPYTNGGSAISSGDIVVVGDLVCLADEAIASGATGDVFCTGVAGPVTKTTGEAWTQGQTVFWNASTVKFTTTATGATRAGCAYKAAGSSATTGYVLLNAAPSADIGTQGSHIADPASAAAMTQDTLTDSTGGSASTTLAAATNTTNLTDNGGGTADGTVASQAAPTTITDSSGLSGSHDDTIAATAAIVTLTDSTGGSGTHDDTLASGAAPVTLTDSSGLSGTHDDVIAATAAIVTLTDSTGGSGTHDDTLASGAAPVTLTDNTGGSGTHDDTLAAVTPAGTITDNSGGVDPGNNIIAVISDPAGSAGMVTLTNVAAAAGAADQLDIAAATGGESMANVVQPSHPRNITITVTDGDASISAFTITVSGKAPDGTSITEAFTFAGGLAQTGSKVFATLTSIVLTSVTGNGAGDTLDAAWGVKLGVPVPYGSTGLSIVKLSVGGTTEAVAATDTTNNSFTATSAPNGTNDYEVWYEYTGPATTAITAAVAQLAAKQNTTTTAVGVLKQNQSDVGQKVIELVTLAGVLNQNTSDLGQKVIELVTRDQVHAQNVSDLAQKVIELVTLAGVLNQNDSDLGQKVIELVTRDQVHAQNVSDLAQKVIELVTLAGVAQANLKEVTTELATQRSLNTVLINAVASLAAQLAKVKTDVAAVRTGSEANNTAIDSILTALEGFKVVAAA